MSNEALASAFIRQGNHRWRNDDGNESSATWRQSQNTNDTLVGINNIRLRLELFNDGGNQVMSPLALFYSTDNVTFTQITTDGSTNAWHLSASDSIVNGESTTSQLTDAYIFTGGMLFDSSYSLSPAIDGNSSYEYEFCVTPTIHAASGTLYYFRIRQTGNSPIDSYNSIPTLYYIALAAAESATAVDTTFATVHGRVHPQGVSTSVHFLYGTTSGSYTDSVEANESPVSGSSATAVSKTLSGLTIGTTYYYRVAKNNANGYARSNEMSLTTLFSEPTTVSSSASTTAGHTTATIRWTNGNGSSHIVVMKQSSAVNSTPIDGAIYTANPAFGSGTQIGSGNYVVAITTGAEGTQDSVVVTGLQSNTNYYFAVYEFNGSSGSQNYRTSSSLTGNYITTSHAFSTALSFDGTDDYVNLPVTTTPTAYTVEMWVKPAVTSDAEIFVRTDASGPNSAFSHQINIRNGKFEHYTFDGASYTITSSTSIVANTWYHVAIVAENNSTMKLYVNGTETVTGATIGTLWTGGDRYYVGSAGGGLPAFQGLIDEIRIWNYARPIAEIAADKDVELAGSETGLIHYWNCNEGSGTSINDSTSNDITGALFNGVAWTSSETPLPVELVSFNAFSQGSGVELKWNTATEINNYGFEVERRAAENRSLQVNGSLEWKRAGFVEGNGTTNASKEYSFTDSKLSAGKYFYRLKQIDRDGKFSYSQAVEVTIASTPKEFSLEQNYPNPFNPSTVISYQLPVNSHVTLKVYDAIGREVATLVNEVKEAGSYSVTFSAEGGSASGGDGTKLSSGIYFARLQSGDKVQLKKMLLIK